MGMPISLALRGRHTDDAAAHRAWDAVMGSLREADRVFSTYRADSYVSRLARGEIELADCPPEVAEVLALGERARVESGGAFDVRRPGADGTEVLDPSGVVKGWAVQRASAALLVLEATDFCLSAGGDMVCHVASGLLTRLASRHRGPARPDPSPGRRARPRRRRRHLGSRPPWRPHRRRAHRRGPPRTSRPSPWSPATSSPPTSTPPPPSPWAPKPSTGSRPGRAAPVSSSRRTARLGRSAARYPTTGPSVMFLQGVHGRRLP